MIDLYKVSEDYSKGDDDFVVSVSRKVEDKLSTCGRFHVIKIDLVWMV